jgi:hypothetical protein
MPSAAGRSSRRNHAVPSARERTTAAIAAAIPIRTTIGPTTWFTRDAALRRTVMRIPLARADASPQRADADVRRAVAEARRAIAGAR